MVPNKRSPQDRTDQPFMQETTLHVKALGEGDVQGFALLLSVEAGRYASITYLGALCANPCRSQDADAPVRD